MTEQSISHKLIDAAEHLWQEVTNWYNNVPNAMPRKYFDEIKQLALEVEDKIKCLESYADMKHGEAPQQIERLKSAIEDANCQHAYIEEREKAWRELEAKYNSFCENLLSLEDWQEENRKIQELRKQLGIDNE